MEQKTPARGSAFWRLRPEPEAAPSLPIAENRERIAQARELAAQTVAILPEGFSGVLPRGYTLSGAFLVMARFEMDGGRGVALYGRHTHWSDKEANVFLKDLHQGWLTELSAYMRWQLRHDPVANAVFQHSLVHLHHRMETQGH